MVATSFGAAIILNHSSGYPEGRRFCNLQHTSFAPTTHLLTTRAILPKRDTFVSTPDNFFYLRFFYNFKWIQQVKTAY